MGMHTLFVVAANFVNYLTQALVIAIILRSIFTWFVQPGQENAILRFLIEITEPLLGPLRRVVPTMGMLDLSPFVAIILIQILGQVVSGVLINAAYAT